MPLYEFRCETCGIFEQRRSLEEASNPMLCPTCQAVAKLIISAPGIIMTPYALRSRVERSAEPQVVKRSQEPTTHKHHHHHHHQGRPWMIGH